MDDDDRDRIPDARDGLTRLERVVLFTMHEIERELPGRGVSLPMLYGRVLERIDVSRGEFERVVRRLVGRDYPR